MCFSFVKSGWNLVVTPGAACAGAVWSLTGAPPCSRPGAAPAAWGAEASLRRWPAVRPVAEGWHPARRPRATETGSGAGARPPVTDSCRCGLAGAVRCLNRGADARAGRQQPTETNAVAPHATGRRGLLDRALCGCISVGVASRQTHRSSGPVGFAVRCVQNPPARAWNCLIGAAPATARLSPRAPARRGRRASARRAASPRAPRPADQV